MAIIASMQFHDKKFFAMCFFLEFYHLFFPVFFQDFFRLIARLSSQIILNNTASRIQTAHAYIARCTRMYCVFIQCTLCKIHFEIHTLYIAQECIVHTFIIVIGTRIPCAVCTQSTEL